MFRRGGRKIRIVFEVVHNLFAIGLIKCWLQEWQAKIDLMPG